MHDFIYLISNELCSFKAKKTSGKTGGFVVNL